MPHAGLVQATDGNFYGTTQFGGANGQGTVFKITANGALNTLYSFCSQTNCIDGYGPRAALVQGTGGASTGTTAEGGMGGYCGVVCGTVFKVTPGGTLTTLYNFCSQPNCADGATPLAALVQGTDGKFYGTTELGGMSGNCSGGGCGTVFNLKPSPAACKTALCPWTETLLYSFMGDGDVPGR